jgi:putative sterol carrier protein
MSEPQDQIESELPDPIEFGQTIKTLSDAELEEHLDQLGTDRVVTQVFELMPDALRAERAEGVSATVQYDVMMNGDVATWTVDIDDGTCTTRRGGDQSPRLALKMGVVDFIRLVFNQVDGAQLMATGRLKVEGDMLFGMQLQPMFRLPGES